MTFPILHILGIEAFDYFFSLVFFFGVISIAPMLLFKLFK